MRLDTLATTCICMMKQAVGQGGEWLTTLAFWAAHHAVVTSVVYLPKRLNFPARINIYLWLPTCIFQNELQYVNFKLGEKGYVRLHFCQVGMNIQKVQKQGRDENIQEAYPTTCTEQWWKRKTRGSTVG